MLRKGLFLLKLILVIILNHSSFFFQKNVKPEIKIISSTAIDKPTAKQGRPKKNYNHLESKRQGQLRKELLKTAKNLTGGGVDDLLAETAEMCGTERQNPALGLLASNIFNFCDTQLTSERGKGAAILTEGLSLTLGAKLTGVSPSTIARGRVSINEIITESENLRNPNHATNEEKEAFLSFVYLRSPVRSGSIADRRLQNNSVQDFYDKEYVTYSQMSGFKTRSYPTILNWLKELGVKKAKFDRYRCEICFEGRQAERRQVEGRAIEGDGALIAKYMDHIALVQHQHEAAKVDKLIIDPSVLLCIFDYTTIHDLTDEKVRSFPF